LQDDGDDDPDNARVAEVAYNLEQRLRQEIGQPAIVHFVNIQVGWVQGAASKRESYAA
jgi:hypothetical protein